MHATSEPLILRLGPLEAALVPSLGGSLAWFRCDGVDLMRPLTDARRLAGDVLGTAMFPMMPFANRIAGNAFRFESQTWTVSANNPPERFHVHGDAWHRPWHLVRASPTEAVIELEGGGGDMPHRYQATQAFVLDGQGLTVHLVIRNTGPRRMPFGFGLHPWFARSPDVTLQFRARRFYLEEPVHVAGDPITLPPELDFAEHRPLPTGWRNNDYGGWDGKGEIRFPCLGLGLRLRADPIFGHLMFYADPTKPYFCLEPQTNAAGAFNRSGGFDDPGEGTLQLDPGASAEGSVRFEPFPLV